MSGILHIIDARTPQDCLLQLALLGEAKDAVVSAGPPRPCVDLDLPVNAVHAPLGLAALAGLKIRPLVSTSARRAVHAWSPTVLRTAMLAAEGLPIVLSLPCMPPRPVVARLIAAAAQRDIRLTVPTENLRRQMLALGADATRTFVLPPPARPINDMAQRRQRTRAALGIAPGYFLVAAPGEMTPDAGQKYASWTHAIVRRFLPQTRMVISGEGMNLSNVRSFIVSTGFESEQLTPAGRFPLADVLAAADAAMFLPRRDVGVAPVVAAMAAGVPIVAADTPDLRELLGDGAGLLAPPAKPRQASAALAKLIDDPALARSLGAAAQERAAEKYSVNRARGVMAECYRVAQTFQPVP
ncbi:MAG: glycosyltransferase [Planctomycetaceae bacterium]|nr:glycosyltransferase [Planctomycetaceae bacterium]